MLNVEYRLKIGQDEFTIRAEVKNELEFFEKLSFYSNLPKVGPNGETDLKITHRTTKKGSYYSLVSEQAKQEYKLGQLREGGLFSKGWSPLYNANVEETEGEITETQQEVQLSEPAPQATVATPKVTAPAAIKTPAKIAAPVGIPKTTVTPTTVKTSPTASVTSKPGVNSATASKANDVLARFNIGTKG